MRGVNYISYAHLVIFHALTRDWTQNKCFEVIPRQYNIARGILQFYTNIFFFKILALTFVTALSQVAVLMGGSRGAPRGHRQLLHPVFLRISLSHCSRILSKQMLSIKQARTRTPPISDFLSPPPSTCTYSEDVLTISTSSNTTSKIQWLQEIKHLRLFRKQEARNKDKGSTSK